MTMLVLVTLTGCSTENSAGQGIVKLDRDSRCVNGYERIPLGKGYITVFNEKGQPVRCSMEASR